MCCFRVSVVLYILEKVMKRDKTLSVRVTETLLTGLDNRASELNCSKADLIERALLCFLGIKAGDDCSTQNSVWGAIEDLRNRIMILESDK